MIEWQFYWKKWWKRPIYAEYHNEAGGYPAWHCWVFSIGPLQIRRTWYGE